jgi:hypothetical protein
MLRFVLLLVFLWGSQVIAPEFETDVWPEEGRPRLQAAAGLISVREKPSTSAELVGRVRVPLNVDLVFDETRYQTLQAGNLRALSDVTVRGRNLGPIVSLSRTSYYDAHFPDAQLTCAKGTLVKYLLYRAEGTCFVKIGENVIEANPCPDGDAAAFVSERPVKTEWWIKVRHEGKPLGWVLVDGKEVKELGREF